MECPILNNLQQLLCVINWIQPSLGIFTHQLTHLFNTLKGDFSLNSPTTLSPHDLQELDLVNQHINQRQLMRVDCRFPIRLFCFPTLGTPHRINWSTITSVRHERMVFLSHQLQSAITTYITALCQLIIKGCERTQQLFGHDPSTIHVPLTQIYLQQLSSL